MVSLSCEIGPRRGMRRVKFCQAEVMRVIWGRK